MNHIRIPTPAGEMIAAGEDGKIYYVNFSDCPLPSWGIGEEASSPVLEDVRRWLEEYFSGGVPECLPPIGYIGTEFRRTVWELLETIPYGESVTYGQLASRVEAKLGRRTSARAVGQAVGDNPISVLIPCHRVLGTGGALTGYAGGLERKRMLLRLEHIDYKE